MDERIRDEAKACLERNGGDWGKAAASLRRKLERNPDLKQALLEPLLDDAIWNAIRTCARAERTRMWSSSPSMHRDADGIESSVRYDWLRYPLTGGKPLGKATAQDLRDQRDEHARNRRSNAEKERFFEILLKRTGETGLVEDYWTSEDIEQAHDESRESES